MKSLSTLPSNVVHAVARLAGPAIGVSLLETLVFLVDRVMLGRYSSDALAGMQICGPVVWAAFSLLGAFSVGTIALVGRAVGAGDRDLAAAAARASLALAVVAGAIAGALVLVSMDTIFAAFPTASPAVLDAARGYLETLAPGLPLLISTIVASAVLQAAGDTRTPFVAAIGANAINIVVNYFLIFGHAGAPELGTRGAAIGSLCAMAFNIAVLLLWLCRRDGRVSLRGRGGERAALSRVVVVSWAAFGERAAQQLGYFGYVAMIGALGAVAMAANQALVSIESICWLSADGFGIAAAAIVAQRLGAQRPDEAALGARVAVAMAVALLGTCAIVFVIAPSSLVRAFTTDAGIVREGAPCLYVAALAQPFMAISVVLTHALRGAGDTRSAFLVSLLGGLVVRLAVTYVLVFHTGVGLLGVWLGSTADWIVRTALLVAIFARGRWRGVRV